MFWCNTCKTRHATKCPREIVSIEERFRLFQRGFADGALGTVKHYQKDEDYLKGYSIGARAYAVAAHDHRAEVLRGK